MRTITYYLLPITFLFTLSIRAATTNSLGHVVLIDTATGDTRPANSIATPVQTESATTAATAAQAASEALAESAAAAAASAAACASRTSLYSSNYVVTSTVYVQSIGGVPYDASNQVITVRSVNVTSNIQIVATVRQTPLATPILDWRQAINSGAWSNVTATVASTSIPAGVTNAAAAYLFTLPKPSNTSAFFRVVDNSSGASGSGLYWMVFGGIYVDGKAGKYCTLTNVVGSVTNRYLIKGGIVVEPTPL